MSLLLHLKNKEILRLWGPKALALPPFSGQVKLGPSQAGT